MRRGSVSKIQTRSFIWFGDFSGVIQNVRHSQDGIFLAPFLLPLGHTLSFFSNPPPPCVTH